MNNVFKFKIIIKLSSILILSGAFLYVYYTFSPTLSKIPFPKCPSYSFFGIVCPGCGSQRAVHELLHFNLLKAFRLNPLLVVSMPFLIFLLGVKGYNFVFDKNKQITLLYSPLFVKMLLIIICIYFVVRNIPVKLFLFLNPNLK
jgi:hypothetical protein